MKTKDLISEALSLPVEERVQIVESILISIYPPEEAIDRKWAQVAKKRLAELRLGKIKGIPSDDVFNTIWKRYA